MEIRPCVGANNTLSLPFLPPSSESKISQISTSFEDSSKISQITLMKLLIKMLQFFTLSNPFHHDIQNGAKQNQEKRSAQFKDDANFNALPPFASYCSSAMIFFFQLFSVIFVLNIEEFSSPLVLFSYWRNKIS